LIFAKEKNEMSFKITIHHIWNKLRLYLSFMLFVFYFTISILFLFTDTWEDFLSQDIRYVVGGVLILFCFLRLYISYRRYKRKHKHIVKLTTLKKEKKIIDESQKVEPNVK
jgi:uncharacterized membrane protein (DUF373 family)